MKKLIRICKSAGRKLTTAAVLALQISAANGLAQEMIFDASPQAPATAAPTRDSTLAAEREYAGVSDRVASLALPPGPAAAPETAHAARPDNALAAERQIEAHDDAALARADPVDRQLAEYARQVPDMGFLRLHGERALHLISALPTLLGEDAANADYEHDAPLRETLVELQMQRIALMVREGIPSATLFKVGAGSQFEHRYLCVITLDTRPFLQDPKYASRLMAPSTAADQHDDASALLIQNEDLLPFTVDHEVYHCLDAYYNGPTMRKTRDPLQAIYQDYLNEARADAFASRSFRLRAAAPAEFLQTLAALRDLSLLDMDLTHFTADVIRQSVNTPATDGPESPQSLVATSRTLVAAIAPSSDRFGAWVASAMQVLERLGQLPAQHPSLGGKPLPDSEETMVANLQQELLHARDTLALKGRQGKRLAPELERPGDDQYKPAQNGDPL